MNVIRSRPSDFHFLILFILLALAAFGCAVGAHAQPAAGQTALPASRVVTVGFKGPIGPESVTRLQQAVALAGAEHMPARLIVFLDSHGGDGLAAMKIGRLLRAAKAHVFVTGTCHSACVFAFAGGVYRSAAPLSLGIHSARITVSPVPGHVVNVDTRTNEDARELLERATGEMRAYLKDMGMPDSLFAAMEAVPSTQIRLLRADEAAQLGLAGFDPQYLAESAAEMRAQYGVNEQEYVRRSARVLPHCAGKAAAPAAFVACYKRELVTGR